MSSTCRLLALALPLLVAPAGFAQTPPSYARDVRPFLTRYCVECHNAREPEGGLVLETYQGLMEGGKRGSAVRAGKPNDSILVRLLEGKQKPVMPPAKARQPARTEVALVRAWVLAGAKDDSSAVRVTLPAIVPKVKVHTPVSAVAYAPDGKSLAAGGRGEVLFFDVGTGELRGRSTAGRDRVTALAFSAKKGLLAVAASTAGEGHEVRLWSIEAGVPGGTPRLATRHGDVIHQAAFSPDGKLLATCSYDRLVKLWDVEAGKERHVLKDHSDSVHGLSFSPDGRLLASSGADRAVKVWDVSTGRRLYTLGESTDWVYAVAFSPDGKHLAAAGVDRSIRVWEVDATSGRIVHSVFAHQGPITRLAYSEDGKVLYSLSEDRTAKEWDTARMVERTIYPAQPETPLVLAVRPDRRQLAVGRFDGALLLLDGATGKEQKQLLPLRPTPAVLEKIAPSEFVRGRTALVKLAGKHLDGGKVVSTLTGLTATPVKDGAVHLTIPASAPPGAYTLRVKNEAGESAPQSFTVDRFATLAEVEPNDSARTGQAVSLPVSLAGAMSRAGDVDWFRIELKAGQEVGVQAITAGSKLETLLQLLDPEGNVVTEGANGVLGHRAARAGTYAVGIRDREYRGGAGMHYRLHIGDIPVVTAVFPLGLQRSTEADIHLEGVHLGEARKVRITAPATVAVGTRLPVNVATAEPALGAPSVVVGEFPEVDDTQKDRLIPTPGTANGRLLTPGATQTWRFPARKGQRLILEVNARRIGSPIDSTIEILDATGRPLPRATLRCLARTFVTFRDHDSRGTGIRIEAWNELVVNDWILVGSELLRIRALPRNPDDDCQFFAEGGQRLGFLGTTPTHQSQGTPMYKVAIHPPGTTLPPNGMPVVTLFWRNDDGGPGPGKDSRLVFDPPADGTYQVRIGDARGEGSVQHAYRLTIRPPRPDFRVSLNISAAVSKGGAVPVRVNVQRSDEFDGVLDIKLTNLPPGFHAPMTNIPAGENSTAFALHAEADVVAPATWPALELEARAVIDGKEVTRKATGKLPRLIAPGEIVTTTAESAVTLRPGGEARVTVRVERRGGFKGRIPIEVQGLPHGVRVLDVGLNGILITPAETTRTFVLYCEPWVTPMVHPIVVLARREGKNTEHAAKSVELRVAR